MNTKWMPIIIALVVAIFAGFVALKIVGSGQEAPPQPVQTAQPKTRTIVEKVETETIYVARKPIGVGEVIDSTMIDSQPWPQHLLLDQFVVGGDAAEELVGMIARSAFQSREPFILEKLADPNDPSVISASLSDGMRLVTISVDAVSGLAGFVFPGDRVDILLTREAEKPGEMSEAEMRRGQNKEMITQTLATNIKVLAVDQSAGVEGGDMRIPSTVSLEVAPDAAHRIALGEEAGRLLLLLRGFEEATLGDEALIARESGLLAQTDMPAPPSSAPSQPIIQNTTNKKRQSPGVLVIRGVESSEK